MTNQNQNTEPPAARVREIPLTDGSKVYDVAVRGFAWHELAGRCVAREIVFACEDASHANELAEQINRAVSITVDK